VRSRPEEGPRAGICGGLGQTTQRKRERPAIVQILAVCRPYPRGRRPFIRDLGGGSFRDFRPVSVDMVGEWTPSLRYHCPAEQRFIDAAVAETRYVEFLVV
jgi:hypothetical protein